MPMENPPGKLTTAKHRLLSLSEQILCYSHSEIRWEQTGRLASKEEIGSCLNGEG